ncbi:molybdate ABC transporter substrate-binding protein [Nocardioides sp. Soil777]|uniref:molybdate ABC transporter substrate-binding protein n=1 Tax=Nocardioides sp. Soil777 TaxID=1736409 RepID=UPI0009EC19EC|nr:substrate-binding domain-containing protein [Nocardioides sp. Soil777]
MRRPSRAVLVAGLAVALVVVVVAVVAVVRSVSGPEKTIEVSADSSLRHAFAALGEAFEEENDVAVDLTVGSTVSLTAPLANRYAADGADLGATPDVFVAADPITLYSIDYLLTGEPAVIAEDRLVIAVPAGNPGEVSGVEDLTEVDVAACVVDEPCGRAADAALASAGIELDGPRSADSASTLEAVTDGSAEAGLVLASEASGAGSKVETIELPWAEDRVTFPSISLLTGAPDPEEGQAFIDFVLSEDGQDILEEHGFRSAENPHLQPEG